MHRTPIIDAGTFARLDWPEHARIFLCSAGSIFDPDYDRKVKVLRLFPDARLWNPSRLEVPFTGDVQRAEHELFVAWQCSIVCKHEPKPGNEYAHDECVTCGLEWYEESGLAPTDDPNDRPTRVTDLLDAVPGLRIADDYFGDVPVQIHGLTPDGREFYFRYRYDDASLEVFEAGHLSEKVWDLMVRDGLPVEHVIEVSSILPSRADERHRVERYGVAGHMYAGCWEDLAPVMPGLFVEMLDEVTR